MPLLSLILNQVTTDVALPQKVPFDARDRVVVGNLYLTASHRAGEGPCVARQPLRLVEAQKQRYLLRLLLPTSILFAVTVALPAGAQDVQLHYDWRHSVDPRNNARNFPALTFKDFKSMELGSFLIKVEADLNGSRNNVSKVYSEISQTLKFWDPSVFLHLEYTGGIGLFDGATGGYYLDNAYLVGAAHPFKWKGSWASIYLAYKYTNFTSASHDPQFSIYWGKGFFNSWDFASTAVMWTQNKNHGDASTGNLSGKRFSFLSENEIWYKVAPRIAVGSETRISVNVYATDHKLHVYPTIGGRYLF